MTPFPLQFADCCRIEHNDAVFTFNEVGSGKTISAELMALHYLYNNPGQEVLVITTPALSKPAGGSIFEGQWSANFMPLLESEMKGRISVISNDYRPIKAAEL